MKPTPKWQKTLLSPVQIKQLCMMASQAFKAAKLRSDPRTDHPSSLPHFLTSFPDDDHEHKYEHD